MTDTDRPTIDRDHVRESRKALRLELEDTLSLIHVCSDLLEHGDNLDPGHVRSYLARLEAVDDEREERSVNATLAADHNSLTEECNDLRRDVTEIGKILDRANVPDVCTWCKPAGSGIDTCEQNGKCVRCGGSGKREPPDGADEPEAPSNLAARVEWSLLNSAPWSLVDTLTVERDRARAERERAKEELQRFIERVAKAARMAICYNADNVVSTVEAIDRSHTLVIDECHGLSQTVDRNLRELADQTKEIDRLEASLKAVSDDSHAKSQEFLQLQRMYNGASDNLDLERRGHQETQGQLAAAELRVDELKERLLKAETERDQRAHVLAETRGILGCISVEALVEGADRVVASRDAALQDLREARELLEPAYVGETIHQAASRVMNALTDLSDQLAECQARLGSSEFDRDVAVRAFAQLEDEHKAVRSNADRLTKLHADSLDRVAKLETTCADQAIQIAELRAAAERSDRDIVALQRAGAQSHANRLNENERILDLDARWRAVQPLIGAMPAWLKSARGVSWTDRDGDSGLWSYELALLDVWRAVESSLKALDATPEPKP